MTFNRLLLTATALALLSACAAERKPPAPVPAPAPATAPLLPPPPEDWRDAAQTPGNWSYRSDTGGSSAQYETAGAALIWLRCDSGVGGITLGRAGAAAGPVPLTITTTSTSRSFTASPKASTPPALELTLPARDAILDAMAFSRGRFMIEVPGLPALYLPAWAEVGRVIEDCR